MIVHDNTMQARIDLDKMTGTYFWFSFVYKFIQKKLGTNVFFISFAFGILEYTIGFLISLFGGIGHLYLTTKGFYLLAIYFAFFLGMTRYLEKNVINIVIYIRGIWDVNEEAYLSDIIVKVKKTQPLSVIIIICTLLSIWMVIGITDLFPSSAISQLVTNFIPSSISIKWFIGDNISAKILVLNWFITIAVLYTVPVIIGTCFFIYAMGVFLRSYPVIPIPAYVNVRAEKGIRFIFNGTFIYAVAVLAIVTLYEGVLSLPFVIVISFFVVAGISLIIVMYSTLESLINKAREEFTSVIAEEYYHSLSPFKLKFTLSDQITLQNLEENTDKLIRLQERMEKIGKGNNWFNQFLIVIPTIAIQGIPYIGFLLPLINHK